MIGRSTKFVWDKRRLTRLSKRAVAVVSIILFSFIPAQEVLAQDSTTCPVSMPLNDVGNGIAVNDNATGSGWILWTEQNVFTRFNPSPYPQNAAHLIAVQFKNGQWYFDNNGGLNTFSPASSDCLVASVNFDSDTVTSLKNSNRVIQGIDSGYDSGNLNLVANIWDNKSNAGEFGVSGTTLGKVSGVAISTNPVAANNTACPANISIGDVGNGIAASDNATGSGWVLWSEQDVFTRFSPAPYPQNAKHLIAVKYSGGQWLVDNNSSLKPFTPAASDCLVASVNFSTDIVTPLSGIKTVVEGIDAGYASGNFSIVANRWGNAVNPGEFGISGSSIVQSSAGTTPVTPTTTVDPVTPTTTPASTAQCPATMSLGDIGKGIAANDQAVGSGWILWSAQSVFSRFSPAPYPENADHLIAVRYVNGQWYYDNNGGLKAFTPSLNDCLVATVNFDSDSVSMLSGADTLVNGIASGFTGGDLVVTPNIWNGVSNAGEFGISGSTITKVNNTTEPVVPVVPVVPTNEAVSCPATITLGTLGKGIAANDNATGKGWLMWSEESVFSRFQPVPYPENADHLIAVRYVSGQWYFDNNGGLHSFTPRSNDCLLATVDFDADSVLTLKGESGLVNGIDSGYETGNFQIVANRWGTSPNAGEFGVSGTTLTTAVNTPVTSSIPAVSPTIACPIDMSIGNVGNGIAVDDGATGEGWFMWSEQNVFNRFSPPPYPDNATNFVAVKYVSGQWFYDNNGGLTAFDPVANDCLVASVNFNTDNVVLLQNTDELVHGIASGYTSSNLVIQANIWDGVPNAGEFRITATQLRKTIPNVPPVANSGGAQILQLGESVQLDGSSSADEDGSIVSWAWSVVSGAALGVTQELSWTPTEVGVFSVQLLVTDDDGDSDSSFVAVTVTALPIPPVAQAGTAQTVQLGESVQLDGTGSVDEDGSIVLWRWTDESGNVLGTTESLSWIPTELGPMTLQLRVTDNDGDSSSALVVITVTAPPIPNVPPVAVAGTALTVELGESVQLDGSDSKDEDGSIVSWAWTDESGSDLGETELLAWTPTEVGVFSVQLLVTDDDGDTDSAFVAITVTALPIPPVANAGTAQTVVLGESVQLDGSNSADEDGGIISWRWTDESGSVLGETELLAWTPTDVGVVSVELLVTDDDGDTDNALVDITVTEPPIPIYPHIDEYQLVFGDEFTATVLDDTVWDTSLLWGPYLPINNEEQMYIDTLGMHSSFTHTPFTLTGDTLKITASKVTQDLQPPTRPAADSPLWKPNSYSEYVQNRAVGSPGDTDYDSGYDAEEINYLSGILTSYGTFNMTHGYVEMRAKLPAGRGLWPAFWMLPQHWVEDVPEIDVMEFLGQDVDRLYNTYHYFDVENDWAQISTPSMSVFATDWTQEFHTFGVAWSPRNIIWYVDGVESHRISDADYDIANQPMHLIANLAVGGNWPGTPDAETLFPAVFEIDYIRAYKKKLSPVLDLVNDYQLMFSDEFTGSSLDASKWNTHFLWGPYLPINNEEQYYVDALGSDAGGESPFSIADGILSITARTADDPTGFSIPESLPAIDESIWLDFPNFQNNTTYVAPEYSSGIITSYDSFKFAHGYAEIRAKIPAGDGLWPAFWLLNGYYVGQQPEIDIMEVRGENPSEIVHSYHYQDPALVSESFTTQHPDSSSNYADGFYTYGVRWEPGKITWYIDGIAVHSIEDESVAYQVMYVIANLAVGGDFNHAATDSSILPLSFDIDYIRVYQEVGF